MHAHYDAMILQKNRFQCCLLGATVLFATGFTAMVHAQVPVLTSRQPSANAVAASGMSPVVLGFSSPVPATTAVRVVGNQYAGRRLGPLTVTGNTASLTPSPPFGPGELVRVSVPSTGAGIAPQVYEFRAAAGAAAATFGSPQTLAVGIYPRCVAPCDFDGDGDLDLAVSNAGTGGTSSTGRINLYLNNGQGVFTASPSFAYAKLTTQVAAADLDTDGDLDLFHLTINIPHIDYSFNNGPGTLQLGGTTEGGENDLAVADFNGDGYPDYASHDGNNGTFTIGLNTAATSGARFATTTFTFGSYLSQTEVVDLNNDGNLDLVVPENSATGGLNTLFNNGAGQFTLGTPITPAYTPNFVAPGDVDGDGRADLLFSAQSPAGLYYSRNLGGGSFAPAVRVLAQACFRVKVADFNGDGLLDVATTSRVNGTNSIVLILLGNGAGQFTLNATLTANGVVDNFTIADLNGDRRLDLALAVPLTNTVNLFFNQAAPLSTASALARPVVDLYPNPVVGGMLHVTLPLMPGLAEQTVHAELRSAIGQLIQLVPPFTASRTNPAITLNVGDVAPGLYSLHLQIGEKGFIQRVVIQ